MRKAIIATSLLVASCVIAFADERADLKCAENPTVKALDAEIRKQEKTVRQVLFSHVPDLIQGGECIQRANRMFKLARWVRNPSDSTVLLISDYYNNEYVDAETADLEDALACLKIKRYEQVKACSCKWLGAQYQVGNEPLEAAIYKTYDRMRENAKRYLGPTVSDKGIRDWINHARDIHDCINIGTLTTLQNTERKIAELLGQKPPEPINPPDEPPTTNTTQQPPPKSGPNVAMPSSDPGTAKPTTKTEPTPTPAQRQSSPQEPPKTPPAKQGTKTLPPVKSPESTITGTITVPTLSDPGKTVKISRPAFLGGGNTPSRTSTPPSAPVAPSVRPTPTITRAVRAYATPGTPRPASTITSAHMPKGGIALRGKVVGETDKDGTLNGIEDDVLRMRKQGIQR